MDDQRCSLAEPRDPEPAPGQAKQNGVQPKQKEETIGEFKTDSIHILILFTFIFKYFIIIYDIFLIILRYNVVNQACNLLSV